MRLRQFGVIILAIAGLSIVGWATFVLSTPCSPQLQDCPELPVDYLPYIVSVIFFLVGILTLFTRQPTRVPATFLLSSIALSAGLLSGYGNELAGRFFYISLSWLAPLILHDHILWVKPQPQRWERFLLAIFYSLAILLSLPLIIFSIRTLNTFNLFPTVRILSRLSVVAAAVVTILDLIVFYRISQQRQLRARVRFIFMGAFLGLAPLVILSMIPDLLGLSYIPHTYSLVFLLFIPVSYIYASFRSRFIQLEKRIERSLIFYLTVIFLTGFFLLVNGEFRRLLPGLVNEWIWISDLIGVTLLLLFTPVRHFFGKSISWFFYGSEKSFFELVSRITEPLTVVTDRETFTQLLVGKLSGLLHADGSMLFLKTRPDLFELQGQTGYDIWSENNQSFNLSHFSSVIAYLEKEKQPVEIDIIRRKVLCRSNSISDRGDALNGSLVLPLISADELQAVLVIKPNSKDPLVTYEDRQVLTILARQAGIAAHNVRLMEDLRQAREEISKAHRKLLMVGEQERRHLAYEIHDNAVQQLIGISYLVTTLTKQDWSR